MWAAIFIAAYVAYFVLDALRVRRLRKRIEVLMDHKARLRAMLIWLGVSIADLDVFAPWLTPDGKPLPPAADDDALTIEVTECPEEACDSADQVGHVDHVDQEVN